jgi:hypothetical protein
MIQWCKRCGWSADESGLTVCELTVRFLAGVGGTWCWRVGLGHAQPQVALDTSLCFERGCAQAGAACFNRAFWDNVQADPACCCSVASACFVESRRIMSRL